MTGDKLPDGFPGIAPSDVPPAEGGLSLTARAGAPEHYEDHQPHRADWRCRACGSAWPCPQRKLGLLAEFGRHTAELHVYMTAHAIDAGRDMPGLSSGALYNRFLAWIGTRGDDLLGAGR